MERCSFKIKDMNLRQIADSGQVFRMTEEDGGFLVRKGKEAVLVKEEADNFTFFCSEEKFHSVWYDYFDLETDYAAIKKLADKKDAYLKKAIASAPGIRILKQDLWEMIVSFIISQNNNIPRIKSCIEKICSTTVDGGFPTPEEISCIPVSTLRDFGFGYRDEYVNGIAKEVAGGSFDLDALKKLDYEDAHKTLLQKKGIGKKVADCICVFGLHHLNAFPIDTHVKRLLSEHYPSGFPFERYKGCAAVMQQYMFYYEIKGKFM